MTSSFEQVNLLTYPVHEKGGYYYGLIWENIKHETETKIKWLFVYCRSYFILPKFPWYYCMEYSDLRAGQIELHWLCQIPNEQCLENR